MSTFAHGYDIVCMQETHIGPEHCRPSIYGMKLIAEIRHRKYGSAVYAKPTLNIEEVHTEVTDSQIELIIVSLAKIDKYNLDLIGLCEMRWRDSGEHLAGNYHYVWSGPNNNSGKVGQAGVALAMSRNTRKALISWRPINERMLEARFEHRHGKLTIIVAYAPTNLAENDKKADFYALLQDVAGSRSPHDITIALSDTNAALSRDARTNWPDVVGTTFVDRTTNDNGDRLLSFCRSTDLCIADSWFLRVSKSIIGPGTAMMVSRKKPSITSSSRIDGCDASHSAVYSEALNSGTPITVSYAQTYD